MKFTYIIFFLSFNLHAQSVLKFANKKVSFELLRSTYKHLSDESFNLKLSGSLDSPLLFYRSFVNTFYAEMSAQGKSGITSTCFGDAHPENFGFILFNDKTRFIFNDLDDSGRCSFEFDLLRYFVATSLAFNDLRLLSNLINQFTEVMEEPSKAQKIDPSLIPSLSKKNKKILEKYSYKNNFNNHSELISIGSTEKQKIIKELLKISLFQKISLLDVVRIKRETGGSGGLDRYWLLVKNSVGELDILELKEIVSPALSFLETQPIQSSFERLEALKNDLWGENPIFYHAIILNNQNYLIRSRTKDDVSIEKLTKKQLQDYLFAQVSILALHHSKNEKIDVLKLANWLKRSIPQLHDRYQMTYNDLKQKR